MAYTRDEQVGTSKANRVRWLVALTNVVLVLLLVVVGLQPGIDVWVVLLLGTVSFVFVNGAIWFGLTRLATKPKKTRVLFCLVAGGAAVIVGLIELLFHENSDAIQMLFAGVLLIAGAGLIARSKPASKDS